VTLLSPIATPFHYATKRARGSPQETLLRIQRVENLADVDPIHWKPGGVDPVSVMSGNISKKHISLELVVHIKQKGVTGVETPLVWSFLGGLQWGDVKMRLVYCNTLQHTANMLQQHRNTTVVAYNDSKFKCFSMQTWAKQHSLAEK